jgi:ComF family protein
MRLFNYTGEYLFPRGCPVCGAALLSFQEVYDGICGECRPAPDGEEGARCGRCGKPLISEKGLCLSCRNAEESGVDAMAVIYPYTGKYKRMLAAYKFGGSLALGRFFAGRLIQAVKRLNVDAACHPVLAPVPPRPGKIKKTGWDQIAYLAGVLERGEKNSKGEIPPLLRCLKRLPSDSQKKLDRKGRLENLRGKIVAVRKVPPVVILFDDVVTTGATLEACATALKNGGAEKVYGVCLFYTS